MAFQDPQKKSQGFPKPGAKPGAKPAAEAAKPREKFKPREAPLPPPVEFDRPRRAPKAGFAPPPTPVAPDCSEEFGSHDFPAFYEPALASAVAAALTEPAAPALDPRLDRLIEISGAQLGCPHEEILHLKALALQMPIHVESFCQHIFDERIKPLREKTNPLLRADESFPISFWLEGHSGKSIIRAPSHPALLPYHGQRLDLYDPSRTPFPPSASGAPQTEP